MRDQRKHQSSTLLSFVLAREFPAQMASNAENVSILWHHHAEIWQASRQHCRRDACQISERLEKLKPESRGF